MASTRILFPELGLEREGQVAGRGATKLKPNLAMFERIMGGGVGITVSDIFSKVLPDMFQVRVYSQNSRVIKMISPTLPAPETIFKLAPSTNFLRACGSYKSVPMNCPNFINI